MKLFKLLGIQPSSFAVIAVVLSVCARRCLCLSITIRVLNVIFIERSISPSIADTNE